MLDTAHLSPENGMKIPGMPAVRARCRCRAPQSAIEPVRASETRIRNYLTKIKASPRFGTSEFATEVASLLIDHSEGGVQPRTQ